MAHWYNSTTKTYIIAFSRLFSDIHVKRMDSGDAEVKDIKIPLVYASKQKLSYLLQQNDEADASKMILPAMGFNIEGLEYDPSRKVSSLNEIILGNDQYMLEGIPYNYNFSLSIKTKYQDDMWQIIEQLLYIFKPGVSLDVKELPFPDYVRDIIVNLEGVDLEFQTDFDQESSRELTSNFNFILKGWIYPASMDENLIEHIDVNFLNKLDEQILNISHDWIDPDIVTTWTEN